MTGPAFEEQIKAMTILTNTKGANITGQDLAPFVHENITHLGHSLTRDEWASRSAGAFAAVPESVYEINEMTSNEKEQKVSIKASWKTKEGKEPLLMNFTYQFVDGKIKETSSSASLEEITEKFTKAIAAAASG